MVYHHRQNNDGSMDLVESTTSKVAATYGAPRANGGSKCSVGMEGKHAIGVVRVAANVADEETLVIGSDTFEFDRASDGVANSGAIAVTGHADDTPANATNALISTINSSATEAVTAIDISANEILLVADEPGNITLALSETMAGSNNVVDSSAMRGGSDAATKDMARDSRVPNATEVALGNMHFYLPFTPTFVDALVTVTATGVQKAWDGKVTISGQQVTIDNTGSTDWATTDTVRLFAVE